jgi:cytosine/adenosine deaminase-related metal-dependent hydrolase
MAKNPPLLLRARVVLPINQPPLEDGAVCVSGNRITAVGKWRVVSAKFHGDVQDLGDVILLPGLVNAHCHLDYTDMAGLFPPPMSFTDWIKLITTEKSSWSNSDFRKSWTAGAEMLVRTGTTTVGDVEAVPELLPHVWESTPLRVISFLEMTGIRSRSEPRAILRQAVERIDALTKGRCQAGLSPHAPYSTLPELLRLSANTARWRKWLVTTHIAESSQEFEMFVHTRGEMFDWLRRNERDMSDCGGVSPVQHAERNGILGANLLAIHVNYLADGDAALLGRRNVNVVHCPRSHAYFQHQHFPMAELRAARVNVCLGTDSLATVRKTPRQHIELNIFEEMRAMAAKEPSLSARTILAMATVNGAKALGQGKRIGRLADGLHADLIAVPFAGKLGETYDAVLRHHGPVAASLIDGQWAIAPK